jgi:DNA mismatch repair protein MutH
MARAWALTGRTLGDLAAERALPFAGREGARTKGKTGELLEQILGATGGAAAVHDFPELGVELKTVPIDGRSVPRECTYVCKLPLADADRSEWATSWAKAKLARVLWVPIVTGDAGHAPAVGTPLLWSPTAEQLAVLGADFDEALGAVALGGVEALSSRTGRWLHVRPKAASSRARTWSVGRDADWVRAIPRGFYLRTQFTGAILRDPAALP